MDYQDYILFRGLEFEVFTSQTLCPHALFRQTLKLDLCKEASSSLSYNSGEYIGANSSLDYGRTRGPLQQITISVTP